MTMPLLRLFLKTLRKNSSTNLPYRKLGGYGPPADCGVYPAAFTAISSPVLMLHGACGPYPGRMIRDTLRPYLPQIEYIEFERCGHSPQVERFARHEFFRVLKNSLVRKLGM
jgi:pimeloyl-ACP methyl ester carboxylesterase